MGLTHMNSPLFSLSLPPQEGSLERLPESKLKLGRLGASLHSPDH